MASQPSNVFYVILLIVENCFYVSSFLILLQWWFGKFELWQNISITLKAVLYYFPIFGLFKCYTHYVMSILWGRTVLICVNMFSFWVNKLESSGMNYLDQVHTTYQNWKSVTCPDNSIFPLVSITFKWCWFIGCSSQSWTESVVIIITSTALQK